MKTLSAALALTLIAAPALAQTPPPAPPVPPSPVGEGPGPAQPPRSGPPGPTGRGAYIKMQAPGGGEITVRCADGETTRACVEVVGQLLDRARSAASERRRDWGGDRGDGMARGGEYRDRDRPRD